MKRFPLIILITFIVCTSVALFFSCNREEKDETIVEEIQTARPTEKNCFTVCDVSKNPDLRLVTNAQLNPPLVDGIIDSTSYFWTKYKVRTHPIRLTQNFLVTSPYTLRYGWDSGVLVNRVQLQCLVENIAFGCENDWVFNESQGYTFGFYIFFDGLFSFDTYEKGNGNNWKFLYSDFKKELTPSVVPDPLCIYPNDRAVQAQTGDFYYNYFRFPNKDGIYKLVLKFNPSIKGCRAVRETDYTNNEKTVILEIREGSIIIK